MFHLAPKLNVEPNRPLQVHVVECSRLDSAIRLRAEHDILMLRGNDVAQVPRNQMNNPHVPAASLWSFSKPVGTVVSVNSDVRRYGERPWGNGGMDFAPVQWANNDQHSGDEQRVERLCRVGVDAHWARALL